MLSKIDWGKITKVVVNTQNNESSGSVELTVSCSGSSRNASTDVHIVSFSLLPRNSVKGFHWLQFTLSSISVMANLFHEELQRPKNRTNDKNYIFQEYWFSPSGWTSKTWISLDRSIHIQQSFKGEK